MISRAKLRGYKLDEDCKRANTTTHEYGLEDDRVFCHGLYNCRTDEIIEKCLHCKAFVYNAKPLVKENQSEKNSSYDI